MIRHHPPVVRRRTAPASARHPRRGRLPARRPAVEALEGRALMSFGGGLDFTFGDYGTTQSGFHSPYSVTSTASVLQPNGDLVVVGEQEATVANDPLGGSSLPSKVITTIGFSARRYLPNGSLDPTFLNTGLATVGGFNFTTVNGVTGGSVLPYSGATGVALTPAGQILVVGNFNNNAVLLRLNSNGGLDGGFGQGGVVLLGSEMSQGPIDYVSAVAALPGGDVAVSGAGGLGGAPSVEYLAPDGSVDAAEGLGGLAFAPLPANASRFVQIVPYIDGMTNSYTTASPVTMAVQPDGSVIVTANALLPAAYSSEIVATRFTPTGQVDTSFGTDGDATVTPGSILPEATAVSGSAIALQPDGKIVLGGSIDAFGQFGRMLVARLDPNGQPDTTFGIRGANIPGGPDPVEGSYVGAIAVQPDGKVVLADAWTTDFVRLNPDGFPDPNFGVDGTFLDDTDQLHRAPTPQYIAAGQPPSFGPGSVGLAITPTNKILVAQVGGGLTRLIVNGAPDDFNQDGISDPAIEIFSNGLFGDLASGDLAGSQLFAFGPTGLGKALPAPGAYNGFGIDEPALYLPRTGEFVIREYPFSPGAPATTVTLPFGLPGYNSLPAPGDYTGSGSTQLGIYDPTTGIYAYRPGGGSGGDVYVKIGGTDPRSIPVPGDYFGTGHDDVAIYEPTSATFLIQNPVNGQIASISFGVPGLGNTVPVPGDYDGSGRAELAVYLPNQAEFVYRSAKGGGADSIVPFGAPGIGAMLPAPGDYDGSGHLEVGGYLEGSGIYAYRPAYGDHDVYAKIGAPVLTLPFNLASATDATTLVPIAAVPATAQAEATGSAEIPLTPDVLGTLTSPLAKKHPVLA